MSFYKDPKDSKKSIRLKYNRRREYLRHSLEQFIIFAKERVDEEKYGKIYKKDEVDNLLKGAIELLEKFPDKKEHEFTQEDFVNFELVLEETAEESKILLKDLKNNDTYYIDLLKKIREDISKEEEK